MKEKIQKTAWILCVYNMMFCGMSIFAEIAIRLSGQELLMQNKELLGSLAAALSGLVIILFYIKKEMGFSEIFSRSQKKFTGKNLITVLAFMLVIQVLTIFGNALIESILSQFGHSIAKQISSSNCEDTSIIMTIYIVIIGPIVEELVFRGVALKAFRKYGKVFAILASSLFFGIYHGNIAQMFFAAAVGVIFAYITLEYSIFVSMAIHIFNNTLSFCFANIPDNIFGTIMNISLTVLAIASFVFCIVFLVKNWRKIREYKQAEPTDKGAWKYLMTSAGAVIFIFINLGIAYMGVVS